MIKKNIGSHSNYLFLRLSIKKREREREKKKKNYLQLIITNYSKNNIIYIVCQIRISFVYTFPRKITIFKNQIKSK